MSTRVSRISPDTNGQINRELIWLVMSHVSILRSVYLSIVSRGFFLVARGTRLKFGKGARVRLEPGAFLFLGFAHFTPAPTSMHLGKGAEVVVSGTAQILRGCRVFVNDGGRLSLGSRTYINDCSTLTCFDELSIGSACSISWNTNILDTNIHEIIVEGTPRPRNAPVRIDDGVWIGTGATILPGVTVGAGAVVAAGSVVTTDVPPGALAAGNPARVIRQDIGWEQ
jgi:acetyltransferase-like isoleucine patch superfamily enzyme